ncbi:glycoside hydrolase family 130 protein [Proteiniphilum sp. UBA1028]|uniref:glycoside hydrolase family 130 protein n=1 Tax=Proteiniphilum sp. UBA1028 TaxID=1947251 RepID=UPI000E7F617C|nr:glycoside hydrolase family 130 protein [Proteiniphilum sp. UBA1028]HBG57709.1 glycosidase [Porphyromonadaceae bacterium]
MIQVNRLPIRILPSSRRTLVRPFVPGNESQVEHILFRIFSTPKRDRKRIVAKMHRRLEMPHDMSTAIFLRHYENIKSRIPSNMELTDIDKQFIGAYFTQQYALESTALFNPSIVEHPVQDKDGATRFIISLRAIGEGHISSITFMEGEIDSNFQITIGKNSPVIYEPERKNHIYEKNDILKKANELEMLSELNKPLFEILPERFTFGELSSAMNNQINGNIDNNRAELINAMNNIRMLALSNFTLRFDTDDITERAIYPASPSQSNGLEDARFVRFTRDDGTVTYYATFTAYDGKKIMPEMLETNDFKEFTISTLSGSAAKNKGMALFPRKVNGRYMMLGRQDNESLYIMQSDNLHFWYDYQPLLKPTYDWELTQIGNGGSPIEIEEGWLVITHGVGPVRTYSLGAALLDKNDPRKVIGRLDKPLLTPARNESSGYVPNVIYTCGAMVLDRTLVLPYAITDVVTKFATVSVDEIIKSMKKFEYF